MIAMMNSFFQIIIQNWQNCITAKLSLLLEFVTLKCRFTTKFIINRNMNKVNSNYVQQRMHRSWYGTDSEPVPISDRSRSSESSVTDLAEICPVVCFI